MMPSVNYKEFNLYIAYIYIFKQKLNFKKFRIQVTAPADCLKTILLIINNCLRKILK